MTTIEQQPRGRDVDPEETAEWLESFDGLFQETGARGAEDVLRALVERAGDHDVPVPSGLGTTTDYVNTISAADEPEFPGREEMERAYRKWMRWNAAIMVHRAQAPGIGVGGHISTYAGAATLYEVGFNHFFRGQDHPGGGDQI
ncbi:pyruvate dehydrogenase (acetyl-transferring), homodimeric type, partial [Galactobacter valiniphilus]